MPLRPMHVRQRDIDGCGVACVAMMACVTYDEAWRACFPRRGGRGHRNEVDGQEMIKALARLGYKAYLSDTFKEHNAPAILVYSYDPLRPSPYCTHCVVWDPAVERLMDPGDDTTYVHSYDQDEQLRLWQATGWSCIILGGKLPGRTVNRCRVPSRDRSRDRTTTDGCTYLYDRYDGGWPSVY